MSFNSDRKRHRSWRDSHQSHHGAHSSKSSSNRDRNYHESQHKKRKMSHSNTHNNSSSNSFIKPSSDLNLSLERENNALSNGTMTYNRHHHKNLSFQRRILPIYKHRDEILYSVERHKVSIIVGETGSGKTTQIPQYLHESGWTASNRMICCTQPRRISTISIANRVAKEMNDTIGNTVGYSIRFDSKISEKTRIKFMTDGMLLSELLIDPLLSQYSVIILDEAHERSIYIDLLLGLIYKLLQIRLDLRLIVSSATMNAVEFEQFFTFDSNDKKEEKDTKNVNILCVEGRTYPVETFYLSEPCKDYISKAADTVISIHYNQPKGDILVFLTGENEIRNACQLCENRIKNDNNLIILPMYAGLSFTDQLKVFRKNHKSDIRKVIFATNIAETSITIDGIVYVIDTGFVKLPSFDPLSGVSSLFVTPISKACANQRRGRAGRVSSGQCFRLYTQNVFHSSEFQQFDVPEIQRCDLTECILKLKALGIDNVLNFDFLSPPPVIAVTYALELLYALNVIDDECKLTQPFGRIIAELPCDPRMGAMLIASEKFGCSEEILSIAAMLQLKNVWINRKMSKLAKTKMNEMKLKFAVLEGDHLTYLNIFNSFVLNGKDGNWAKENFLDFRSLRRATQIRSLLKKYLKHFKIPLLSCQDDVVPVLKCIIKGYFSNAAQIQSDGSYKTVRGNQILHIHPNSILDSEAIPWVIYHEVIQTDAVYMHDVTAIKPTWLQQLASHFYKYKTLSHEQQNNKS